MDNNELLKEIKKEFKDEFKRHMGILLDEHKKEIQIVGEGHSTLLRKIDEVKTELHDHKVMTEKHFDRIEKKLDTTIKQNDQRFKRVEDKIGIQTI